jgi:hypothetical protein
MQTATAIVHVAAKRRAIRQHRSIPERLPMIDSLSRRRGVGRLPGGDLVDVLEREADIVEAFEEAPFAERVDGE